MKRQKFEEKCVSKQKRAWQNNKGFSLIELMIATGISMVVSLGVAGIFVYTVQQFVILVEMNNAQENLLWTSYHTKNLMSQAVELNTSSGWDGYIRDPYITSSDGATNDVAAFLREWGQDESELFQTAIFVQNPSTLRGEDGQGIVFFDVNTENGPMSAGPEDIFYDKIVQYDVDTVTQPNPVTQTISADVIITTRYHRSSDRSTWNWCTPNDIAASSPGCTNTGTDASFVDSTMNFTVSFRNNNALKCEGGPCSDPDNKSLSIHGGLYYFKFNPPRVNF